MRWVESLPPAVAVPDELRQAECLMWLVDALSAHDRGMVAARDMRLAIAGAHVRAWRKSLGGEAWQDLGRVVVDSDGLSDRTLIRRAIQRTVVAENPNTLRMVESDLRTIWHRGQK